MLYETLKRLAVTGLGLAVLTKEKAEEIVQDLVNDGEITRAEGQELLNTWMKRIEKEKEDIRDRIQKEIEKLKTEVGVLSREEFSKLETRVRELEKRLGVSPEESEEQPKTQSEEGSEE